MALPPLKGSNLCLATCKTPITLLSLDRSSYKIKLYIFDIISFSSIIWIQKYIKKSVLEEVMAKGIRKKMKGYFKKGHVRTGCKGISDKNVGTEKCDQVRYIRLTSSQQSMVEENPILPAALENEGGSDNNGPAFKFLREKKPLSPEQNIPQTRDEIQRKESQSYRLFHCGKLWQMMNEVTKEHFHRNPRCKGTLDFDFQKEEQWGLCWRECAFCSKCSYTSKMYKLYSEVESRRRGRKSATANVGMNVAMTQTPVGVTGVRKLLLGSNIPAPAKSSMQRTAKIVNKKIEKVNIQDMKQRRDELKLINKARGKPETEIAVQADGTYNNSLWSGVTRTPYQPATQMTYLVAENVTDKHQIINLELVNKLCSKHGYHTQESEACDIKSGDCSATACIETSIGNEKRWARLAFEDLLEDGLSVKYVTTDQDTAAHMAATALFEEGMTNTEPVHQVDIRHLSASHRKQMKNSIDVLAMMPGKTIQYRQYLRNRFATDMSKRCNAEFQAIYRKEEGNFRNILHKTDLATNAIKRCYSGDHSRCSQFSLVCSGEADNNWILRSAYLNKNFKINLNSEENEETLLQCIEYRLGVDVLNKTKLNTNSQKCEATNRSLRRSLPKNSTFGRNFPGRAHSAIHSVNNGPGESIRKLCHCVGCTISSGSKVDLALVSEQRQTEIQKKRARTLLHKAKHKRKTTELYRLYEKDQEKNKYIRSQLAKKLKNVRTKKKFVPHHLKLVRAHQ